MDFFKDLFLDALNGFSPRFIPLFFLQLLASAFMGHVLHLAVRKKFNDHSGSGFALLATGLCLLTTLVKYSLPFTVLAAAVILLLLGNVKRTRLQLTFLVLTGTLAVGCGIGSVVQSFLGFIVILLILLFIPVEQTNEAAQGEN